MTFINDILPLRGQAAIRNGWLKSRLDTIIPQLLDRENIDMWIIACREYNEDPVLMSMLPATSMSARRRTMLIFLREKDGSVRRLTLSRYGYDDLYETVWDPDEEDQHDCLARLVAERDPATIGINSSSTFSFGDGMSFTEHSLIYEALADPYMARIVNAEGLCVGWLERRLPEEILAYPRLVEIGHQIIARAFSTAVIHPGITTTDDVVWWMRQTMQDAGLQAWFQPTVDLQAPGQSYEDTDERRATIMPGDMLHCDMGFHYLGLATDQQQHAYVLRPGESDAPAGLRAALADGNRLQDIHMTLMRVGATGNELLRETLEQAKAAGIRPQIYTHPLGFHGHAAGPIIGLWDRQEGVPGVGDYPLYDDTAYSIELNVVRSIPEWDGQDLRIMLEEDAVLTNGAMRWLDGRQESFYLIG
ncbi:MAG: M24 family metallopeptidase [Chloroflexi bacterium]|nr:M24 family metallopeptidase [Chloroflexota bacterium]